MPYRNYLKAIRIGVELPFDRLSSNCRNPLCVSLPRRADRGMYLSIAPLSIDQKATWLCHSERSAAESKNLKCLS